jgi:deoxycytidylate deaminase
MAEATMTMARLREILPTVCSRDTSADPGGWTPKNPLWGHCAVVSLVAQSLFGGSLRRGSLDGTPFAAMRSHYWNCHGSLEYDLTSEQFGATPPRLESEERTRAYLLSSPETARRYKELTWRIAMAHSGATIFEDKIYRLAFMAALDSPCQKMRFGAVLTHGGAVVSIANNTTIGPMKALCEPTCIRHSITSRTESMIGACGHAEEHVLWDAIHRGIPPSECELYVAGVYMNGLPWMKGRAEHTCLRCSIQMYNARVRLVFSPVNGTWQGISAERAVETAIAYATKAKTV